MRWYSIKNILLFSGLGLFSYSLIVNYTDFSPEIANILYSRGALIYTILTFNLLGYSTLLLSEWVNKRYTLTMLGRGKVHLTHGLVALLFLLLNYSLFVVAKVLADVPPVLNFSRSGWHLLIIVWMAEMVIVGLLLSNRTLRINQQLRQEAAKLQIENAQAKYSALQSQLNPHFLFNSLNTLIAEIKYNPENAINFTQHLSRVYRYVLQCQERQLVPLDGELEFMESYLFLHRVRLGDCIRCDCQLPDDFCERQLPPLTLQLLVENVIKHNSISPGKPMTIRITHEGDYLVTSNSIVPKKTKGETSGIGLRNLSARCRLMTGKEIVIEKNETVFTVKTPTLL